MAVTRQPVPKTKNPHFATLLLMALAPEEVGQRIEAARKAKGWTHDELRDAISAQLERRVNVRTVQRWQKGRNPKDGKSWLPRLGTLMELADVLEVPRSFFVEEERPADPAVVLQQISDLQASQAQHAKMLAENSEMLAELLRLARGVQEPPESAES